MKSNLEDNLVSFDLLTRKCPPSAMRVGSMAPRESRSVLSERAPGEFGKIWYLLGTMAATAIYCRVFSVPENTRGYSNPNSPGTRPVSGHFFVWGRLGTESVGPRFITEADMTYWRKRNPPDARFNAYLIGGAWLLAAVLATLVFLSVWARLAQGD
jgi:hypothetical protein